MKNIKSKELFTKALDIIPLASQTFSKSYLSYYKWDVPLFAEKWEWAYLYDIDWNKYIDFVWGLLPVILWYKNEQINEAIKKQLDNWITFSLSSPLEYKLSKKLTELIPCAEMVRFWKNWTDVTSAAVRLSRYITSRDKVAVCGYHGWQDWYIWSTTRNWGVPTNVQNLTLKFEYNNIDSLEKLFTDNLNEISCVIMEPMNIEFPKNDFLKKVKDLCHKNGALFILDEIITWFRYNISWAQKIFWVTPDLATFGKSIANWMPISALVWKKEYMKRIEDIFFSWTFGGETLSIVAALKTIEILEKKNVLCKIEENWLYLKEKLEKLFNKYDLSNIIKIVWHSSWQLMLFKDYNDIKGIQIKSYIQKYLIENWILWYWSFNLSYSHTKEMLDILIIKFDKILLNLINDLNSWKVLREIEWIEISDIFKIR